MAYEPVGHAARFIEELKKRGEFAELTAGEGAQLLGLSQSNFPQAMKTPLLHGCLHRQRRGREVYYRLEPYEATNDGDAPEFVASRWSDGDVILYGLEETADGGHLLRAENAAKLVRLLGPAQ
jgi:DNA-binding transcriptional ArsR family regulator